MDEDREQRGFTIKDRRRFSESGERREEPSPPAEPPPQAEPAPPPEAKPVAPSAPHDAPGLASFSTFILGLSTQALLLLGEIPNPESHALERDLDAARQVIDILGILQEKTRNNLEPGEQSLLESVLYDLRMRYVELQRSGAKGGR